MQFLRTMFAAVLFAIFLTFCASNYNVSVKLQMWPGWEADINVVLLLLIVFLIGLMPALLYHSASRWNWRRRIDKLNRQIEDMQPENPPLVTPPLGEDGTPRPGQ
ncbi:MAG: lipopolysaccharide assembly protein LapA domain-containing protein [Zymomonas mobilis subsp. pomaceae]|uniref:Lipopolysaccharide assembly protein A domain-containing protein n=1 Tax=Zymomonas mobilis subsp. pomaceae (strain ATCC 29192 / DSM 22645 / JCM 10191 / CCUG 17912 / NBRC 13757 / NCIMB 11200 / NRRL B-4491 / Barker I) TaxID=579138 RepID=F8ERS5_ZYMMT|nr:lipopolysaccharide assembly protein LapA domain-containing protein [Zymomonas mobilis]AEI37533.1 hypothetical protein Zymop_0631 [Zymomonas mobilis subsp. pomaceae ATCC 29192]MDX5948901.1 lipopolysaccharide assembly protein LapA domain-containing protein [Zymomonas mobilis subsp. pomaceae]